MTEDLSLLNKLAGVQAQGKEHYKLNEVTMSGDTGEFIFKDILKGKGEDGKYETRVLGNELEVVFLKLRWKLSKYEEVNGTGTFTSSTEYDDKHLDTVTIFPSKEKGLAINMKAKYALKTVRIAYCYVISLKQVVRLTIKSSALTGEENKGKEMGLFDYQKHLDDKKQFIFTVTTKLNSVVRNKGDRRKEYRAMFFVQGEVLETAQFEKVRILMHEVHEKVGTVAPVEKQADMELPPSKVITGVEYPEDDINPEDIPF